MRISLERSLLLLAIALTVPAGFALKLAVPGNVGLWCNMYCAGVAYEIFWILVLRFVWQRLPPFACGIIVFVATCALEIMQLWHPPLLQAIRSTFAGAALIGTSFDFLDFPHYAVGSMLGVLLATAIRRRSILRTTS